MKEGDKKVYLQVINIPSSFLYTTQFDLFLEIRAELVHWEEDEPKFVLQVNNLSVLQAANIKWMELEGFLSSITTTHYKAVYGKQ